MANGKQESDFHFLLWKLYQKYTEGIFFFLNIKLIVEENRVRDIINKFFKAERQMDNQKMILTDSRQQNRR
jgi:hypothetical protein